MPQTLSEEEATTKICPFISGRLPGGPTTSHCLGSHCACWGWTDPHQGQVDYANPERQDTPVGATIKSPGWEKEFMMRVDGKEVQRWRRYPVIGPRRGQCEAMSPYTEVNTS